MGLHVPEDYLPELLANDYRFVPTDNYRSHRAHDTEPNFCQRLVSPDFETNIWFLYDPQYTGP